jgi:molecular chaperone DnaK
MAIIGIDLGTTYSAAARCVDGRPEIILLDSEPTLPSVVGLQKNGKIAVGKVAKRNQPKSPQDTVVEVKRLMGSGQTVRLGDKTFTPQELSAMILRRIKELAEAELGEPVTGAVITCPAYFTDPQRGATKEAGEIAGLKVLHIFNEPTAAAYAYGLSHGNDDSVKLFLVYDLGGGTFDVTVIRMTAGQLKVIGTGGDAKLGGGDFDDAIVGWIMEHLAKIPGYLSSLNDERKAALRMRLKWYAEEGKKALCNSQSGDPFKFQIPQVDVHQGQPVVFNEPLTMAKFEELIAPLVERSLKCIATALEVPQKKHQYTEKDLTAILLVGGSTRVPLVRTELAKRFPNTPIWGQDKGINPDEIVALGASIKAAEADPESDQAPAGVLLDVTGHTLSVAVFDERRGREVLHCIIPKETQIPTEAAHRFSSKGDFQELCRIKVFQGEGEEINPAQVTMIGEFDIRIAPIAGPTPLRVGLALDVNGILLAHATDEFSGKRAECRVNYTGSARIPPEQLARKKVELEQHLNAVIGQTANPLDGPNRAAGRNAWAPPLPPPPEPLAAPASRAPAGAAPPAATPGDVTAVMNPIMRNLYNRAINSFDRIPPDRQALVMQLVTDIELAARAGDQQKLMTFFPQLSQALQGVS